MIIITGAAGFIGSCLVRKLNDDGHWNLILADDFTKPGKARNLSGKKFIARIDRMEFPQWLERFHGAVQLVYHLGARTDTTEKNTSIFDELNLNYSKKIWQICTDHQIPLVYASSAATYGLGQQGYDDTHELVESLHPLNPYGESKNEFDKWVLHQEKTPPFWAGLKFFNVYGPNEYHKGRMASVIFHTEKQIRETGGMKLFKSHHPAYKDGQQSRDFIYVMDVVGICTFLGNTKPESGLYNVGTGQARTFYDLAFNVFKALQLPPNISYMETPQDIRDTYQYFTQANMAKLRKVGYENEFYSLELGIEDYVQRYLVKKEVY